MKVIQRQQTALLVHRCGVSTRSKAFRNSDLKQPSSSPNTTESKGSPVFTDATQSAAQQTEIQFGDTSEFKAFHKLSNYLYRRTLKNIQYIKEPLSSLSLENLNNSQHRRGLWLRFFIYLEEVSYMSEVNKAQANVLDIKNNLREEGDNKRAILRQLEKVRNDINHIYKDMKYTNNRASEQYLQLVKQEVEFYTMEKELQEAFIAADEREQKLFNTFSTAINILYEKEKLHSNFLKVLGIIGTVLASIITALVSIAGHLNNQNKFYTLRKDIETSLSHQVLQKLEEFSKRVELKDPEPSESWASYIKRHSRWIYGWAVPKN